MFFLSQITVYISNKNDFLESRNSRLTCRISQFCSKKYHCFCLLNLGTNETFLCKKHEKMSFSNIMFAWKRKLFSGCSYILGKNRVFLKKNVWNCLMSRFMQLKWTLKNAIFILFKQKKAYIVWETVNENDVFSKFFVFFLHFFRFINKKSAKKWK